ncbi:MAG: MBG domain-containing protein, partial [Fastidiosipilaceae bacterium]
YTGEPVTEITPEDTGDKAFYAKWELTRYRVDFDINGGEGTAPAFREEIYNTEMVDFPGSDGFSRDFYTFFGWSSEPGGAVLTSYTIPSRDSVLYAVWGPNNVTVTFNLNGGFGVSPPAVTTKYGEPVALPENTGEAFIRTGYTFGGWSETPDGTVPLESYTAPSDDANIYAIWVPVPFNITWNWIDSDGSQASEVTQAGYGTVPSHPDPPGYQSGTRTFAFAGWSPSLAPVSGDTTYTAKYENLIPIDIPSPVSGLKYKGTEQVGVPSGTGYTVTGNRATVPGIYQATAVLSPGYMWADGTAENKVISWTINKVPLTVKANNISVTPTATQAAIEGKFSSTVTGFVNGETASEIDASGASYNTTYWYDGLTGKYTISVSGYASSNYTFVYKTGTLTVGDLNVTFNNMVYKGTAWEPVPVSVYFNGHIYNRITDWSQVKLYDYIITGYADNINAGTAEITLRLKDSEDTSSVLYADFEISKASVAEPSGKSLAYNGYDQIGVAAVSGYAGYTVTDGIKKDAGSYDAVVTLTDTANCRWAGGGTDPLTVHWTIARAVLSISVQPATVPYNSDPPASYTPVFSGFKAGDNESNSLTGTPVYETDYAKGLPAGTYYVSTSGYDCSTGNYTLDCNDGTLTVTPLNVDTSTVVFDYIHNHTYTGNALTPVVRITVDGTSLTGGIDFTTHFENNVSAGDQAKITIEWKGNYTGTPATMYFTIDKAVVQVPSAGLPLKYNGVRQIGVNESSSLYTLTDYDGTAVGTYSAKANLNDPANYIWSTGTSDEQTILWEIQKVPLTITVKDREITYGDPDPTDGFELEYITLLGGDDPSVIQGTPVYDTTFDYGDPAGPYLVYITGGLTSDNYEITYLPGNLYVKPKVTELTVGEITDKVFTGAEHRPEPAVTDGGAVLTIDVDYTLSYENNINVGTATVNVTGMGSYLGSYGTGTFTITPAEISVPEPVSGLRYTGTEQTGLADLAGDFGYTVSGGTGSAVDDYTATVSLNSPGNVVWQDTNGTESREVRWSIGKALLTATFVGGTFPYGTDPSSECRIDVTGFVNGETAETAAGYVAPYFEPLGIRDVGDYDIMPLNGQADNYEFAHVKGAVTIAPAKITVTADDKSVTFGDPAPEYTVSYSGFVNGEDESVITVPAAASSEYAEGSDAGEYPIVPSGGSAANYTFVYAEGTLTVISGTISASCGNVSNTYDGIDQGIAVNVTVPSEGYTIYYKVGADDWRTLPYFFKYVSETPVTVEWKVTAPNYEDFFGSAEVVIEKKPLVITPDSGQFKVYGESDPEITCDCSAALAEGDTRGGALGREPGEDAGTYNITKGDIK